MMIPARRCTYHIAVQSKCTINHFDGLNAIESAFSIPFNQVRYSGQMNALPAYAASTCSHNLCSMQTSPICHEGKKNSYVKLKIMINLCARFFSYINQNSHFLFQQILFYLFQTTQILITKFSNIIFLTSSRLSKAHAPVVPSVAHTWREKKTNRHRNEYFHVRYHWTLVISSQ